MTDRSVRVRATHSSVSFKPSFQSAASRASQQQQQREAEEAPMRIVTSNGDASSTRSVVHTSGSLASRGVVVSGLGRTTSTSDGRVVTGLSFGGGRGEGASSGREVRVTQQPSSSSSGFTIEAGRGNERVVQSASRKRRSGEMQGGGGGSSGSAKTITLGRKGGGAKHLTLTRTVGQDDEQDAMEDGEQTASISFDTDSSAAALKRARFVVDNQSGSEAGRGRGIVVAAPPTSNYLPPSAVPMAAPLIGLSKGLPVSAATASRVQEEAAKRLANTNSKTNTPAGSAAVTPAPSVAAAPVAVAAPAAPLTTVLLRNLAPTVTAKFLLTHLFGLFDVPSIVIDSDPDTGLCTGTAEARFVHAKEAQEAVSTLQGQQLLAQPVRMSIIETAAGAAPLKSTPPMSSALPAPIAAPARSSPSPPASSPNSTSSMFSGSFANVPQPQYHKQQQVPNGQTPFSSVNTNIGFQWENDPNFVSDVSLIDDTVFNITNNKMNSAQAAAHLREGAEREEREQRDRRRGGDDATGRPAGKMLNVQLKPKSVVVSGAAAQAQGKPSITLSKHAAAGSSSSSSAPSLVLASGRPVVVPARR